VTAVKLAQSADNEMSPSGTALAQALADLKAIRDDAPGHGLEHKTLGEVMAEGDSYDWVIKNLFERGDRLMMTGSEGVGKSFLNIQMAIFAASGIHPFWLTDIPPVDVVVVDCENSERQWRRKARGLWQQGQQFGSRSPENLVLTCDPRGLDITRDSDLGSIHKLLDENPCDLLFIGPIYKLVPRAITTDDEAAPFLKALDSLRDRGCAMVMEAHSGHQRMQDLRPVGSSAFLRWPEFGRGLRTDIAVPGRVTFEQWRGDRDERAFPEALMRGGAVPWTAEGVSPALSARFASGRNQRSFYEPEQEFGNGF
jgi:replicative DNA helicase